MLGMHIGGELMQQMKQVKEYGHIQLAHFIHIQLAQIKLLGKIQ